MKTILRLKPSSWFAEGNLRRRCELTARVKVERQGEASPGERLNYSEMLSVCPLRTKVSLRLLVVKHHETFRD